MMRRALTDALLSAMVALLLLGPVSGLVLSGYEVTPHWQRPLWLALMVFVGHLLVTGLFRTPLGNRLVGRRLRRQSPGIIVARLDGRHWHALAALFLFAAVLPWFLGKYWLNVAILALIYVLLALGLNIVIGLAGLLDLGFVAFYAVGAYSYALGHQYLDMGFWTAIPFGAALAACFGMVLGFPVLRMHGDYLAIVTLGFGEIIRLVLNNWVAFTGGPNGVRAPFPTVFGIEFTRRARHGGTPFHELLGIPYDSGSRYLFLYLLLLVVVAFMTYFVARLKRMPLGRAWEALREDETACRSLGINHVTVKLSAFSLGAMVGGLGGVFFAASQGFVNPTSFTFFESAQILAIVILGGMGSTVGVVTAALVLTVLPEVLRDFADFRVLIFGILMVLMMIWRPRGLFPIRRPAFTPPEPAAERGP